MSRAPTKYLLIFAVLLCPDSTLAVGFEPLGYVAEEGLSSTAAAVSYDGSIVVGSQIVFHDGGPETVPVPVAWSDEAGPTSLAKTDADFGYATGVSDDGSVIVGTGWPDYMGYLFGAFFFDHDAVQWDGGLSSEGVVFGKGFVEAVSGNGRVSVGASGQGTRTVWSHTLGAEIVPLSASPRWTSNINAATAVDGDGGTVVGFARSVYSDRPSVIEAIIWRDSGYEGLGHLQGGGVESMAFDVSANGAVVVGGSDSANTQVEGGPPFNPREAFVWGEAEGMVGLGDLPGGVFESDAIAVSDDGKVVVGNGTSEEGWEAFVWDAREGMRSLRGVLEDAGESVSGWGEFVANDISGNGRFVVGHGTNPDGQRQAWKVDLGRRVPEPTTHCTIAIAFSCMLMRRPGRISKKGLAE